jgi:UDP-3-O-[3-hydroxymyristoyl] glucosamine N-acyltransferase
MPDSNFFSRRGPFKIREIADFIGARIEDGGKTSDVLIRDIAPLDAAGVDDISFLDNPRYIESFVHTRAGACIVAEKHIAHAPAGVILLISDEPYLSYALLSGMFYQPVETSILNSAKNNPEEYKDVGGAFVALSAKIAKSAILEHGCYVKSGAEVGANTVIRTGAIVGRSVKIGESCDIGAYSKLQFCVLGNGIIIHPGVKIGQDGFGFAYSQGGQYIKVPQLGRVIIEDDVEVGANTTIDRGSTPDTVIGQGTKIDNLVQIGHNVKIGRNCIIVAQVGISGSTIVQDGAVIGGQVGIAGHLRIGKGSKIAAKSGVIHDVPPGKSYGGYPAIPVNDWHRQTIALKKLVKPRYHDNNYDG